MEIAGPHFQQSRLKILWSLFDGIRTNAGHPLPFNVLQAQLLDAVKSNIGRIFDTESRFIVEFGQGRKWNIIRQSKYQCL